MPRILIKKFEHKSNQGCLVELGVAILPIKQVTLGRRLARDNCAGPWVVDDPEVVDCVEIGGRLYVTQEPAFPRQKKTADYCVSVDHNHEVLWTTTTITEVRLKESQ